MELLRNLRTAFSLDIVSIASCPLILLILQAFPCSPGLPCRAQSLLQPQMLAIMGPPKCGKSTLLSLTAGRGGTPRH